MASAHAQRIAKRLRSLPNVDTAGLHRFRRAVSKELAAEAGEVVLEIGRSLLASRAPGARLVAYGVLGQHPAALALVDAAELERIGAGINSWDSVDMFGCLLAGRAWREGSIRDSTVHRWARSEDRWWRRLALVCTVPLNIKAQGGAGDPKRTLAVCRLLIDDRDDMVVKAVSWALRALAPRAPEDVARFVQAHEVGLAARVKREVRSKLETGLKNGRSTRRS